MARPHAFLRFSAGHMLAGSAVVVSTLLVTLVCYALAAATAPHGAGNLLEPMPSFASFMFAGFVVALVAAAGSCLLSVVLTWVRSKKHFPGWLPVAIVPLVALVVLLLLFGQVQYTIFIAIVTGTVFVCFGIYWTVLTSSPAVLGFLRRQLCRERALP